MGWRVAKCTYTHTHAYIYTYLYIHIYNIYVYIYIVLRAPRRTAGNSPAGGEQADTDTPAGAMLLGGERGVTEGESRQGVRINTKVAALFCC